MFGDYTDAALLKIIQDPTASPGALHSAPYLLELPTPELRRRATARAHLSMNLVGGNYSGAVYSAVQETKRIGLEESPDERYNREIQEREREVREDWLRVSAAVAARRMTGGN